MRQFVGGLSAGRSTTVRDLLVSVGPPAGPRGAARLPPPSGP